MNVKSEATKHRFNRRQFIAGAGAAAVGMTILKPQLAFADAANRKLDIGLIGCGGRGQWITKFFTDHGGFNVVACADYFQDKVDTVGDKNGIPAASRFAGLSGYKRLLEQKLDAVVIETPPFFHPEQAAAAVDAGKHVYLAKPIAVDVPGCRTIEASGKKATASKQCFLVDFQTRAHPSYQEAVKRVRGGMIGKIVSVDANYHCGPTWGYMDEVLRKDPKNPEVRLRAWGVDRVLSGDVITEQNIHAIDVATWFLDAAPVKAAGGGGRARDFLGDCWDHFGLVFHFPNKVLVNFSSTQVGHGFDDIACRVRGRAGTADTHYFGDVWVRSKDDLFNGGKLGNLYSDGVTNNVGTFYNCITKGDFSNPTVAPSVRSNLTTILGRTAAYKGIEVTWDKMMRANEKWTADLKGLKA
jgi:myo-inositol 2-dehydrogenase / D-chiro-inositol 1-dehydrogenase